MHIGELAVGFIGNQQDGVGKLGAFFAEQFAEAENFPVDKYTAVFGEVGLTGEVRGVNFADRRVNECLKMGFKRVILPAKNMKACEKFKEKIELVPVTYVAQMLKALF